VPKIADSPVTAVEYSAEELQQLADMFLERGLSFEGLYTNSNSEVYAELRVRDCAELSAKLYDKSNHVVVSSLLKDMESCITPKEKIADYYTIRETMFERPLEDMPLCIDNPVLEIIARWRMRLSK
jgi:hypothetical protein